MSETSIKKEIQKLQRTLVDALEDVKAKDIQVFDTEHLSPLFERVLVASGASNRQTRALAASVRDGLREAGFDKPRVEGEENGEWVIVDCGAAVVHIMQPVIREYYRLEEIWGEKPVRIKLAGKSKGLVKAQKSGDDSVDQKERVSQRKSAAKAPAKTPTKAAAAKSPAAKKPAAKTSAKATARPAAKAPAKKAVAKTAVKKAPAAKKPAAKTATKTAAKKPAAKTATTRRAARSS